MSPDELSRAAQILLDMPAFHKLWDELEQQAMRACIFAKPDEHEVRAAHAAEARAIIAFRNKLKGIAQAPVSGKKAPA